MYDLARPGYGSVPSTGMPALQGSPSFQAGGTTTTTSSNVLEPEANGSFESVEAVVASGYWYIDGLLAGTRWSDGRISYSDPDSSFDYQPGYYYDFGIYDGLSVQLNGFLPLSAQQQVAMHFALNEALYTQPAGAAGFSVEGFTNLAIDYAGSGTGSGSIRLANSYDPDTAYAFHPGTGIYAGDAWFGSAGGSPIAGNHDWLTMLHELGHSLGLKHGHEISGPGNTALNYDFDSMEYSVMTYRSYVGGPTNASTFETWSAPQTYMMLDIAALQYLYGADFTTNSGNTVYTWFPDTGQSFVNGSLAIDPGGNRIFQTIWDGGGNDTYNLASYSSDLDIDLRPGGYSNFNSSQLADLGGGPYGGHARGNVFNALQYYGDARSLIENAIGGTGHDAIVGNQANNTLQGGLGNDILNGGAGNDRLLGGGGNDVLRAGVDDDILRGHGGDDRLFGGGHDDRLFGGVHDDQLFGGGGKDILRGGGGDDLLRGNGGDDRLFGGGGQDDLRGHAGNDVLRGNGGNDRLFGGTGNDLIDGQAGNDLLVGNGGADRFVFQPNGGDDVVADFQNNLDLLDFRPFDFANKASVFSLATQAGADVMFFLPGGASVELNNFSINLLGGDDIII